VGPLPNDAMEEQQATEGIVACLAASMHGSKAVMSHAAAVDSL